MTRLAWAVVAAVVATSSGVAQAVANCTEADVKWRTERGVPVAEVIEAHAHATPSPAASREASDDFHACRLTASHILA
jgi:hypothetical protein